MSFPNGQRDVTPPLQTEPRHSFVSVSLITSPYIIGAEGLLKKSRMFDKMMHMDQARNSTIKFINGMEAKS